MKMRELTISLPAYGAVVQVKMGDVDMTTEELEKILRTAQKISEDARQVELRRVEAHAMQPPTPPPRISL